MAAARRHDRTVCLLAGPADLIDKIAGGHSINTGGLRIDF
jgi:hypothetical protein